MSKFSLEVHRKVFDDDKGRYLTVRPSADFPDGSVMIFAEGTETEYFGEVRLDMPAEFMRKLGEALIATADELLSK